MRNSSSTSAGATYLDRDRRIAQIREAAWRARTRDPSIQRVRLFGSLAAGTPTPRSDADLLVVLAASPHATPADRLPEMLRALSPLPCPVDLFVLTREEFDSARARASPLIREALAHGIDLLSPDEAVP